MAQMDTGQEPPSPTSSENSLDNPFFQYKAKESVAGQGSKFGMSSRWKGKEENGYLKVTLPKMSFPQEKILQFGLTSVKTISKSSTYQKGCGQLMLL
jgi:hypothetical protein